MWMICKDFRIYLFIYLSIQWKHYGGVDFCVRTMTGLQSLYGTWGMWLTIRLQPRLPDEYQGLKHHKNMHLCKLHCVGVLLQCWICLSFSYAPVLQNRCVKCLLYLKFLPWTQECWAVVSKVNNELKRSQDEVYTQNELPQAAYKWKASAEVLQAWAVVQWSVACFSVRMPHSSHLVWQITIKGWTSEANGWYGGSVHLLHQFPSKHLQFGTFLGHYF